MTTPDGWTPAFADGGPRKRKRKPPRGWHEFGALGWVVMVGDRIASVNDMLGELALHCGYSDECGYEPAFSIPIETPAQLLDAMIRGDRWVAGDDA